MYLYTIYCPLLFLHILGGAKKVEDMVFPTEEGPFLQFLNMTGSEEKKKVIQSSMVLVSTIQKCSLNSRELRFECSREWKMHKVIVVDSEDAERKGKEAALRYK